MIRAVPRFKVLTLCIEIRIEIAIPVELHDRQSLIRAAVTSLSSKLVSTHSNLLAPIAVDAVLRVIDPATATNVDLNDIKTVKRVGGTMDDSTLVDGLVLPQRASHAAGGISSVKNAKIMLIQFCLSPPKTNIEQVSWREMCRFFFNFSRKCNLV